MSRTPIVLAVAALLLTAGPARGGDASLQSQAAPAATPSQSRSPRVTVLQVNYYAQPGKAADVLSIRQNASRVLAKLGLPAGRVMTRRGGTDEDPDVMWECEYPSRAALDEAANAAKGNAEFEEVRKTMASAIRKADLRIWEVSEGTAPR